jgi:hypothetical protein
MKRHHFFSSILAMLVIAFLPISCSKDSDNLRALDEEQLALLFNRDLNTNEMRALKPSKKNPAENYGEKAHDRRTVFDDKLSFIETESPIILWPSAFYVYKHDHEKGECIMRFYWGGLYRMGDDLYYSEGDQAWRINQDLRQYRHYAIEMEYFGGERTYITSTPYYEVDDEFIIPSEICEHCEKVDIKVTNDKGDVYRISQPFISDPTVSPYKTDN